jgi:hypothetical protein
VKRPTLSGLPPVIRPQPVCGLAHRVNDLHLTCDLPGDHVPVEDHAATVRWTAPKVKVQPGERPLR